MEQKDKTLGRSLVLDELLDLTLYKALRTRAEGDLAALLDQLIPIETRHLEFWSTFFGISVERLDLGRRAKLLLLIFFCRIFGERGVHLVLEAIEVHGVRKYLKVWDMHKDGNLALGLEEILQEEFQHEDEIISAGARRKIHPERIRDVFLGFNDGLVELLGAVSGFFAAFGALSAVLIASFTVAVAGAISMAAGAYVAMGSEYEVEKSEREKKRFLGEADGDAADGIRPLNSAAVVGISYLAGSFVPVAPVLLGAENIFASILAAAFFIIIVSTMLAFFSGMNVYRRIATNLVIIAIAASVTYAIGSVVKEVFGIVV